MLISKFSVDEFDYWSKFYFEKYNWRTIPITAKKKLCYEVSFLQNYFQLDESKFINIDYLNQYNWQRIGVSYAAKYSQYLTGIGLPIEYHQNVFVLDLDDLDLYDFWLSKGIKTRTVKTGKGYHVYLKNKCLSNQYFNTNYYDLLNNTHIAPLPPSMHFKNNGTVAAYRYNPSLSLRYKWEDSESDMQEYDCSEFVPKFITNYWNNLESENITMNNLKKIKFL